MAQVEVVRKGFDLDTFQKVSITGTVEFTPLDKANFVAEALQRVEGNQDVLYEMLNGSFERKAKIDGRSAIQIPADKPNVVWSGKVVLDFVKNFRGIKPYKEITDRKAQTAAIMASIKSQPALFESLKQLALAMSGADEDEDDNEDNG